MSEEKTFEPITTQEEFDDRIKARLARERERWAKESNTEDLQAQLQARDEEISQIRREHYRADARRAVEDELGAHGVTEEGDVRLRGLYWLASSPRYPQPQREPKGRQLQRPAS